MSDLRFVSTGLCGGCEECKDNAGYDSQDIFAGGVQDGVIEECPDFSWRACDWCHSNRGGNRHAAHGVDSEGELVHLDICTGCLMEINGY